MKFILLSVGILLLLWYLAPLAAGIFNIGNAVGAVVSTAVIAFAWFYGKIPPVWRNSVIAFACVFLAVVVIPLSFNMARYSNYKTNSGADTVIVLGCKVNGTRPSKYLYDRCKMAADYLKKNESAVAVLSGGQGPDEGISEAQCMKNTLVEMGIDESRLFLESKSTSTEENIRFSCSIIEENSLSRNVLIVTNEFHQYRAKLLCDNYDLEFSSKSSHSSFYTFLTFYTRELMGLVKQIIFK